MCSKTQSFHKFKIEAESMFKSSKLTFNLSFDRIFINLILHSPLPIKGKKVADFSEQCS